MGQVTDSDPDDAEISRLAANVRPRYGVFGVYTFRALRRYSKRFNDRHDVYARVARGELPPPRNAYNRRRVYG